MTAQPGRPQPAFTAGELAPALLERKDLKYYRTGALGMLNVEVLPQGGFRQAPGTRHIARLSQTGGKARLLSFTSTSGATTTHVWHASVANVFNATTQVATYAHPFDNTALLTMKYVQQLDTMFAFHQDVAPHRVLRTGSDASWSSGAAPLVNIPLHDYGGVYVNGVTAKWDIRFVGEPNNGTSDDFHYVATLNGEETLAIQFTEVAGAPDYAAFCTTIKNALEALPEVEPGLVVTVSTPAGQPIFTVEFAGAGNEGDDWVLSFRCTDKSDIACPTYRSRKGVAPGEALISPSRGYPRCGVLYQQRLLMGGLKGRPNCWIASWSGDYFNLETDTASPLGAMVVPMDTTGGETIEEMVAGRSLLIMTSAAEYFLADRTISKTAAPNHVETSRHGISPGVQAAENEGSAIFVQREGGVLYEFRYDDVGQTYVTQNVSLLASHLIDGVTDAALMRSTRDNDANQLYVSVESGFARIFALLREQNVTAATRRHSAGDGAFLAMSANSANQVHAVVQRTIGGAPVRFLERVEQNLLLDGARTITLSPAGRVVTGLADYEGKSVWVIAEGDTLGDVLGPFTVTGGQIADLGQVCTTVTVGHWIAPRVETMPLPRDIGPGIVLERKGRIHTVRLSLFETTSLAVGANGGRIYDIPLFRFGGIIDQRTLNNRFTGTVTIQGLTGYADHPTVVITQNVPGFLHVRGITVEAAL
jgi:hypothetical protein